MLGEHAERSNQNALRAFLPNRTASPALPKRPLANGRLHANHMPDARTGRRTVAAERIESTCHALARSNLGIVEIANMVG